MLTLKDRKLFYAAIKSLGHQEYKAPINDELINSLLINESDVISKLANMQVVFDSEETRLLQNLMRREIEIAQDLIFFNACFYLS